MANNILLSYAIHRTTNLRQIRDRMVCGRILIDSGAFSVWSTGKTISLDEYATYLEQWRGCWDYAITLDVIGDPVATAVNTRKLHERGLPVLPVHTLGATVADFDAMVKDVGYVCVGGLVRLSVRSRIARSAMLQRRAAEQGGGIHALGLGSVDHIRTIRPYSADASNLSNSFVWGNLVYFDGREIQHPQMSNRQALLKDWHHIRAHGADLEQVARTGRSPARPGRVELAKAMSWSVIAADEYVKKLARVPNERMDDPVAGPHLYSSLVGWLAPVTAELDQVVHAQDPDTQPSVWRVHGATHECRAVAA